MKMMKFILVTILLHFSIRFRILKADQVVGIEVVDYHACKDMDYAPITCIKYGEKYYSFLKRPYLPWFDAVHRCRRNHGNLLTIESAAEMKAISDYLQPERRNKGREFGIWTAGNDLTESREFTSIGNGGELTYTNWAINQPNKARDDSNRRGKHCVSLKIENDAFAMFNEDCQEKFSYICELNTTIPNRVEFN